MALIKSDRVKETSTSETTANFILGGAATGYRAFSSVCAIGDTFYYAISHQTLNQWECGLGTYGAGNVLERTTVHASSNSGAKVNFSAGTKECFLTLTARHLDRIQDNGQSTAIGSKTSVVAVNDSATLPDLDLQFADLKTLTAKYGPTPSYSRASTGTYFNASGVLTSAAVNEPRFDHVFENGAWVSKGLLIEEQRTNIALQSQQFDNASWTKFASSISANAITAPDGTITADKLIEDSSNSAHAAYQIPATSAVRTFSCYIKAAERTFAAVAMIGTTTRRASALINLTTGSVVETQFGSGLATSSVSVLNVGNGWFRVSMVANGTEVTLGQTGVAVYPSDGSALSGISYEPIYLGNGTSGIYVWGAQVELGSFSTSYIPTTTSSVIRSADVCQITGSAFTNLWNATEGSIVLEQDLLSYSDPAADQRYFAVAGSSNNPGLTLHYDGGSNFYWERYFNSASNLTLSDVSAAYKVAIAFKTNDYATTLNGSTPVTATSPAFGTNFAKMDIGYQVGATARSSWIQRVRYFRSRLDNTQLVNLSGGINSLAFKTVTGSGSVTVANEYGNINVSVPNPLPIANGGTGAQTVLNAVTNLVGNPPNDGGQYTLASKKTSGTPTFYWVDGTGYAPTLDLLFAANKSLTPYAGPTPSFSRASTGSYFDASGVLRYAALNIFPYSEDINLNFLKDGCTVSSNVTASPDGKLTADKLVEGSGTTSATLYKIVSSGKILSIYAKKSERDFLFLGIDGVGGCYFNLNSGTVGSSQAGSTGQIELAGNGWYRCSLKTSATGTVPFVACSPTDSGSGVRPSYTGNGSSGIFLWGAMFENSEYLSPYAFTNGSSNSGPRFNHTFNGTSWVSRGLLVEEQRTNLLINSNTFSSNWTLVRGTVAQDQTGPDGTTSGWTATCNSTGGGHYAMITPFSGASASGAYTISVFSKKGNNGLISLQMSDTAGANFVNGYFDLTNGVTSSTNFSGSYSSISNKIENVGNGWYRCSLTATKGTANGITASVGFSNDSTAGTCTSGQYNYFYNAQLEFGAFATSSIVTTSAQVTRSADVCQITGSDFSGFWNGTEGTLVGEYDSISSAVAVPWLAGGATTANGIGNYNFSLTPYFLVKNSNVNVANIATSATTAGSTTRTASGYKDNDFAISLKGAAVVADTSGTVPTNLVLLQLGNENGTTQYLNGHIARLRYYPVRLPNATLQVLST